MGVEIGEETSSWRLTFFSEFTRKLRTMARRQISRSGEQQRGLFLFRRPWRTARPGGARRWGSSSRGDATRRRARRCVAIACAAGPRAPAAGGVYSRRRSPAPPDPAQHTPAARTLGKAHRPHGRAVRRAPSGAPQSAVPPAALTARCALLGSCSRRRRR